MNDQISFTRVNNDVNGNPRHACHYLDMIRAESKQLSRHLVSEKYYLALMKARGIGGRKFHNKQFGGGVVFQSYNLKTTEADILGSDEENIGKAQRLALCVTSDGQGYKERCEYGRAYARQFNREPFVHYCTELVKANYRKEKKLYDGEKFTPYQFTLAGYFVASFILNEVMGG